MEILVIGDIHAKVPAYISKLKEHLKGEKREDFYSIQIGDFGFGQDYERRNFHFNRSRILDENKHVFFGGNHDDYDNLPDFHLGDFGVVPFWDDAFFIRGAYSIDKDLRTPGLDWWGEEELSWEQCNRCIEAYQEEKPKIVLSHDAPDTAVHRMFPTHKRLNSTTGRLLDRLFDIHQPELWIFGHWHKGETSRIDETRFISLPELGTFLFDTDLSIWDNIYNHNLKYHSV